MNLIEALQVHAETYPTVYFLNSRIIYPDEIFSSAGFLPLIGRIAEKTARRSLQGKGISQCGFIYSPYKESIFCEKIDIKPYESGGILADSVRLSFLYNASMAVVGMGYDGALDLTPIYDFFMEIRHEERTALVENLQETRWPLYQPVQIENA